MNSPERFDEVVALDNALAPGSAVEVRTQFEGEWVGGFEVVGAGHEGVRVRRRSDGYEIPRTFDPDEIRAHD